MSLQRIGMQAALVGADISSVASSVGKASLDEEDLISPELYQKAAAAQKVAQAKASAKKKKESKATKKNKKDTKKRRIRSYDDDDEDEEDDTDTAENKDDDKPKFDDSFLKGSSGKGAMGLSSMEEDDEEAAMQYGGGGGMPGGMPGGMVSEEQIQQLLATPDFRQQMQAVGMDPDNPDMGQVRELVQYMAMMYQRQAMGGGGGDEDMDYGDGEMMDPYSM